MIQFRRKAAPTTATPRPAVGADYESQVAARLDAAIRMASNDAVKQRIASAPPAYALANSSSDIARHAQLLEPLCAADEVRVLATPGNKPGAWNLDLASLDRPRLLAMFTGILVHEAIEVERAVLATWDDAAALQALVVRSAHVPDVAALRRCLEWSLSQGLYAPPVEGATVTFDQSASALYTACEITGPDRPGLLHAIAVAIANAGADIHAASVQTVAGIAHDRFDLSDARHQKLQAPVRDLIEDHLASGFSS